MDERSFIMKIKAWVSRYGLYAAMAGMLILGILMGNLLPTVVLPSRILGVPSSLWAAPGSRVTLPEGNTVQYLTPRESRSYKSPMDDTRAIDYIHPESFYDFSYDDSIWRQLDAPVLCRVRFLGARDYRLYASGQEGVQTAAQAGSLIYAHVQEVLFDETDSPMQEGAVVSFVWRYNFAQQGRSSSGVAFYPGTQWYLTLQPTDRVQEHPGIPENLRADEMFFVQTHADYVLQHTDTRTRGYWPIDSGRVYTPQRLLSDQLTPQANRLWGFPGADYEEEAFRTAIREKMETLRGMRNP